MTDDERKALVRQIATRVAGEVCPGGTPPCVEDDYHRESCGCMDVATSVLADIELAIRADERARLTRERDEAEAAEAYDAAVRRSMEDKP